MKFTSFASGSTGNAYLVESDGVKPLLLEAGIPIKKLREELSFGLSEVAGCLISHEHGDHSKAVKDLLKAGVDCYMSHRTATAINPVDAPGFLHHRIGILESMSNRIIGSWHVLPFALEHDAAEPLGFLISQGTESLLFVPDTAYVKNRFENVSIIAVECNHIEDILSNNILSKSIPPVVGHRVRRNHMSLEVLIEMLKQNDLSRCRQIFLLHLSDGNSDEARMVKEVQQATGIPTTAC